MRIISRPEEHIHSILMQDRIWSAYAIADLEAQHKPHSVWFANKLAVVLTYKAFSPPILFSHGVPEDLEGLFCEIPRGDYVFTLQQASRSLLDDRLKINFEAEMWRMTIDPENFALDSPSGVIQLHPQDVDEMETLFADHHDRPDAFAPSQVEEGMYFGIRDGNKLLSVAGTHVLSQRHSVAAIGNVFTRPDQRNKGYGMRVSSVLVHNLLSAGIKTIVLNVATANLPAINCYTRIGFQPYCKYQEGLGTLTA
jgi:ribosomal protein S18 acetylase RimI-like enzyme